MAQNVATDVERFELKGRIFEVETKVALMSVGKYGVHSDLYAVEESRKWGLFKSESYTKLTNESHLCDETRDVQEVVNDQMETLENFAAKEVDSVNLEVSLSSSVTNV